MSVRTAAQRPMLVPPIKLLSRPAVRLFVTSTALLFVELFLIRWIPANVIYVGFFSNFLLMASFLGIGVGILLGRNAIRPVVAPFPILLFLVVILVSVVQLNVQLGSPDDIYIGPAAFSHAADTNVLVLVFVVALAASVMAALALPLGPLLRSMPPLRAYSIDIAGSMTGIALFTLLAWMGTGPGIWMTVVAVLGTLLGLGSGIQAWSAVSAVALLATILVAGAGADIWSPYQRLTVFEAGGSTYVNSNGLPFQSFPKYPSSVGGFPYSQIDLWFPGRQFANVLIIGSGNGNDPAVALKRGDQHIDAVEIDPTILDIGKRLHPDHPYQDPRVTATVDDGRAFLRNSTEKYDLVIFAEPDSLALFSTANGIRLESFLFTREAFASVRDHLASNGLFVLYNFYWQPWLVDRLGAMLASTFGTAPIVSYYNQLSGHAAVLAAGPALAATGGAPPAGQSERLDPVNPPPPTIDDWPFLYLREPGIPGYYLAALALVLLLALGAVLAAARVTGLTVRRFSPHFFVLGTAFLLLETRSLVTFGLLFGNTWIVNALVFFAVLASVLAAIGISSRVRLTRVWPVYAALFASLALASLLPPDALLVDPPGLRYLLASAISFAPVFLANLCFTYSFRDTQTADTSFASNLLGAMTGGALEYLALVTGYQSLLLVVAALYGSAYLLATRFRFLADRDLGPGPLPGGTSAEAVS
ncbi:MAG: spermidine synthase [Candidatus Limnocylindrales bacterium]